VRLLPADTRVASFGVKIAQEVKKHDTLGQDLVAMCVNDILTRGTRTLLAHMISIRRVREDR
jgi:phosphoribosylaminoimidazole (AIR) synthetase